MSCKATGVSVRFHGMVFVWNKDLGIYQNLGTERLIIIIIIIIITITIIIIIIIVIVIVIIIIFIQGAQMKIKRFPLKKSWEVY